MQIEVEPNHPFADFRNFLYAVWKHLNLPDPTDVQYDIAHWLQHGPERGVCEAFRGVGKSWITGAFVLWGLYWNQNLKFMVVSASGDRADAFSQFCLRLIYDMPALRHLAPKLGQRRSLSAFDVAGSDIAMAPSVKSVGITGQLTGSRADVIIADDVEIPKNSQTALQREKLGELVKEFDAVLTPKVGSRILYLGTPQCEMSLYNELAKRGYVTRIWPARKPDPTKLEGYAGKLAPYIEQLDITVGSTTDPKRFSDEDLRKREASYGRSGFQLQFMLDTSLSDANRYPLKCSDLIVMDVDVDNAPVKVSYGSHEDQLLKIDCVGLVGDRYYSPFYTSPDWAPYTGSVMFIDPSGRGEDRTAFAVVKMLHGRLWLTRVGSFAGGYDETTLLGLTRVAKQQSVMHIVVEPNFGDGMFVQLLKPYLQRLYPCNIEDAPRATKQKELRIIDTLEPVLNQHLLVIDKSIVINDQHLEVQHQLFHQMTRMTRDKGALAHDDLIDAVCGAVAYWVERLDVNNDDAEERHRDQQMNAEIERFLQYHVNGGFPDEDRTPNWMDRI